MQPNQVVTKPWGREEIFGFAKGKFCGKLLFVSAGESLSLQFHEQKEEALTLVHGQVEFLLGYDTSALVRIAVREGESLHLLPGHLHQLIAISDAVLAEVSTTELDDVVRIHDRYGRVEGAAR